ncbi:hypothetical protein ACWCXX_30305 [Streptomyces sp. NPDC001732]
MSVGLTGKVALVTGAARSMGEPHGTGEAETRPFAALGAKARRFVAFLAFEDSSYLPGTELPVDGRASAGRMPAFPRKGADA